jgi:ATP-dependent HslUV protease ATP-binding subunit HslU
VKIDDKSLIPSDIVKFLDRYIVGQHDAKRSVSIALRNRWRRMQVPEDLQDEIMPKNIIMIGPTGVGKTEIARRIAKLVNAPFIKVEASKFTEVGYVGRDVESMIRDLMELSISMTRKEAMDMVKEKAKENVDARILDILIPASPPKATDSVDDQIRDDSNLRNKFSTKLANGVLDDKLIEVNVQKSNFGPSIEFFPVTGSEGMDINIKDMMSSFMPKQSKKRKVTVAEARKLFEQEEAEKLLDLDDVNAAATKKVEQSGIVFLDEIDKITSKSDS